MRGAYLFSIYLVAGCIGGQTGQPNSLRRGTDCEEIGRLEIDQPIPAGFSMADMIEVFEGDHSAKLYWFKDYRPEFYEDSCDELDLETLEPNEVVSETRIRVNVQYSGSDSYPVYKGPVNKADFCPWNSDSGALLMPVVVHVSTDDGKVDEIFDAQLQGTPSYADLVSAFDPLVDPKLNSDLYLYDDFALDLSFSAHGIRGEFIDGCERTAVWPVPCAGDDQRPLDESPPTWAITPQEVLSQLQGLTPTIQWSNKTPTELRFDFEPQETEACYFYWIYRYWFVSASEETFPDQINGDNFEFNVLLSVSTNDEDIELEVSTRLNVTKIDCSASSTESDCYRVFVDQECARLEDPTVLESEIETPFEEAELCLSLRGTVTDQDEIWEGELMASAGSSQKYEIGKRWTLSFDE